MAAAPPFTVTVTATQWQAASEPLALRPSHLLIQMLAPAYQLSARDQIAPAYQLSALDHSQVIGNQTFFFSLSVSRRRSL